MYSQAFILLFIIVSLPFLTKAKILTKIAVHCDICTGFGFIVPGPMRKADEIGNKNSENTCFVKLLRIPCSVDPLMPYCNQCQTSDTPCWREGPEGARTLCNACGIRWKRRMTKREIKHASASRQIEKSNKNNKDKSNPMRPRVTRSSASKPLKNNPESPVLTPSNILNMSQNDLLECILTRLEELEFSQIRTSLQVRVLTRRLIREKHSEDNDSKESNSSEGSDDVENEIELMMNGDGEGEAWLLASMKKRV